MTGNYFVVTFQDTSLCRRESGANKIRRAQISERDVQIRLMLTVMFGNSLLWWNYRFAFTRSDVSLWKTVYAMYTKVTYQIMKYLTRPCVTYFPMLNLQSLKCTFLTHLELKKRKTISCYLRLKHYKCIKWRILKCNFCQLDVGVAWIHKKSDARV